MELLGLVAVDKTTFILQIVSTIVLYLILRWLLYRPVQQFLEARREKIEKQIQSAQEQENSALALKEQYEKSLKDIQKEAEKIMAQARERASKKEAEIIQEAQARAAEIIEKAHRENALQQERIKEQMKEEIIDVATLLTQSLIQKSLDESVKQKLVEDFIQEVGDAKWLS